MEIDCGSVGVTMVEQNLLTRAGGEAALAIFIVSTLVKTQYLFLTQEYMKLLTEPKMRGDHHTCYPSKAIDAEDGDGNEDEEEEEEDKDGDGEGKEAISYEDGNPEGNKNDPDGEDDQDDNDDEEDENDNDDDDEPNEGGDDDNELDYDDELDEEEEEEEEEKETLQPPKKRKK